MQLKKIIIEIGSFVKIFGHTNKIKYLCIYNSSTNSKIKKAPLYIQVNILFNTLTET